MTDIQVSVPIEPAGLPLPRPVAEAVLRGLLNGTAFAPLGAEQEWLWPAEQEAACRTVQEPVRPTDRQAVAQDADADEDGGTVRAAERDRMAPAHCRYAMQYLD